MSDGHSVWSTSITKLPAREKMASCPQAQSAIWSRGGAVIDPATGNIFIVTGNGPWDGKTAWGDSIIELDPSATRMLGNWTPDNNEALARADMDLGTTSTGLLGGGLIVQGGKDGILRLLSERTIAGTEPHRGGELQVVPVRTGGRQRVSTAPVVMRVGAVTWLIVTDTVGTSAFRLRDGKLEPAWNNTTPGTSPVVAGGLLYTYDPVGSLHVYEPETGREIASLTCGVGHWNSPIVIDGHLPDGAKLDAAGVGRPDRSDNLVHDAVRALMQSRLCGPAFVRRVQQVRGVRSGTQTSASMPSSPCSAARS